MNLPDCMYDYRYERSPEDKTIPCYFCGEEITYDEAYKDDSGMFDICYRCYKEEQEEMEYNDYNVF